MAKPQATGQAADRAVALESVALESAAGPVVLPGLAAAAPVVAALVVAPSVAGLGAVGCVARMVAAV